MTLQMILAPLFVQVALTFGILFLMGATRFSAIRAGEVKPLNEAASQYDWPRRPAQVARSFHNQLETPILFYVLVILALITTKADMLFVVMSWIWVAVRIAHAFVHVTSNRISLRFPLFLVSVVILAAMWIIFAIRVMA